MAGRRINQLPADTAPSLTDSVPVYDAETNITKRVLLSDISLLTGTDDPARTVTKTVAPVGTAADYNTDGVADDVEINAAIAAVNAAGGGRVKLRSGANYVLAATIQMLDNVTLSAESTSVKLIPTSGSSIATVTNTVAGAIQAASKTGVRIIGVAIDGTNLPSNGLGIFISECSDVRVEYCRLTNVGGFGIFTSAGFITSSGTCDDITICHNYIQGIGINDQIGGGTHTNTSTVSNVHVYDNTIIQDCTTNSYANAFDMVALSHSIIEGNRTKGNINLGIEEYPHLDVLIANNSVKPAIGRTDCSIKVQAAVASATQASGIVITGNVLSSLGQILLQGISGFTIKDIAITGNKVSGNSSLAGINLQYCTQGTVVGNVVDGNSAGVQFSNSDTFQVSGNTFIGGSYGVQDLTGITTIEIGKNTYANIGIANTIGGNPSQTIQVPSGTPSNPTALTINQQGSGNSLQVNVGATAKAVIRANGSISTVSYLSIGSVGIPTNTTAGDLTAIRGFFTGAVDVGSNKITSLLDPTSAQDAATKNYVDTQVGGDVTSITGTANQVIASSSTGAVTLSTPQSIGTGSSPTFAGLSLGSGALNTVGNIEMDGTAVRDITVAQSGTGAGNNLTIQAGTALAGASNTVGGTLTLSGGGTTGNAGGKVFLAAASPGSSGTGSNSPANQGVLFVPSSNQVVLSIGSVTGSSTGLPFNNSFAISGQLAGGLTAYRNTTSNTAGNSMSVQASSATSGATNKAGGNLLIKTGLSTGSGTANIQLQVTGNTAASTTDNALSTIATVDLTGVTLALGTKLSVTTGTNASAGTGTLSSGTATISTTAVTSSSLIFLTDTSGSTGQLSVGTKTNGTSFVVNSSLVTDSSTFNWLIIN